MRILCLRFPIGIVALLLPLRSVHIMSSCAKFIHVHMLSTCRRPDFAIASQVDLPYRCDRFVSSDCVTCSLRLLRVSLVSGYASVVGQGVSACGG